MLYNRNCCTQLTQNQLVCGKGVESNRIFYIVVAYILGLLLYLFKEILLKQIMTTVCYLENTVEFVESYAK